MDYSLPGSSVHGIFQARVLEWVAISFSRRYCKWRVKMVTVAHTSLARPKSIFKWPCKQAEKTTTENTRNKGAYIFMWCQNCLCLPLPPLSMNTVCNWQPIIPLSPISYHLYEQTCLYFSLHHQLYYQLTKDLEQRQIALVHGTFVERQVEWISLKVFTLHFIWSIS